MRKRIIAYCLLFIAPLLVGLLLGEETYTYHSLQGQEKKEGGRNQLSRFLRMFSDSTRQADPLSGESVTTQFEPIYNFIHSQELLMYDSLLNEGVVDWDQYQNVIKLKYRTADTLASNIEVFGWHPYWMGKAYESYNFDLLSHVAFFSYNINPLTGSYDNPAVIRDWRSTALIDSCLAHNTKAFLTITNHTKQGNRTFLTEGKDNGSWKTLRDSVILLLDERGGHGVDVNFELVPSGLAKAMTEFLQYLSAELESNNYQLSVVLPKRNVPWGYNSKRPGQVPRLYEIDKLKNYVNLFILTGYDYHTGDSKSDGPIAPLYNGNSPYSIENTVYAYLEDGLPASQLLLGLPYYGGVWTSKDARPKSNDSTFAFKEHRTYRAIQGRYEGKALLQYDKKKSWSAYYAYWNEDSTYYEKVWFDDSLTLSVKYDWMLKQDLAGIAIWALGYDNGYPALWNLIDEKYAADTLIIYQEPFVEDRVFDLASELYSYKDILLMAGIFIVVFLAIGLVVSFFDWRVREVFFTNKTLRFFYLFGGIGIILSVYALIMYLDGQPVIGANGWLPLGLGLVVGGVLSSVIYRRFEKQRTNMP